MKKIILIFAIGILFNLNGYAQSVDTVESRNFETNANLKLGTVISEPEFRKFGGTWEYNGSGVQLTLVLKSGFTSTKQSVYSMEMLTGGYLLKKNGKIIINTLTTSPIYATNDRSSKDKITLFINVGGTYKNMPFDAILLDKNTLMISESKIKGEGLKKDSKLDFFKNLKFTRIK